MTEKTYAPHEQRVIDERTELEDRRTKLFAFIEKSPVFQTLHETDKALLIDQWETMSHLSVILQARIERF